MAYIASTPLSYTDETMGRRSHIEWTWNSSHSSSGIMGPTGESTFHLTKITGAELIKVRWFTMDANHLRRVIRPDKLIVIIGEDPERICGRFRGSVAGGSWAKFDC